MTTRKAAWIKAFSHLYIKKHVFSRNATLAPAYKPLSLTCISCTSCCHPVLSRGSFCMRGHSNLLLYIHTVFLTNSLNTQKHDNLMYKRPKRSTGAVFRVVTFAQKHSKQNDNMMYIFYNLLQINSLQL